MSETREELQRLDRESYISLATFRKNGKAVPTPVWFALGSDHFYVFSEGKAGKIKRLRNGDRIQAAPCNVRGALKGDWIDGRGRIVDDDATVERAYRALNRKYGWVMKLTDLMSRFSGRYDKRVIIEFELDV